MGQGIQLILHNGEGARMGKSSLLDLRRYESILTKRIGGQNRFWQRAKGTESIFKGT